MAEITDHVFLNQKSSDSRGNSYSIARVIYKPIDQETKKYKNNEWKYNGNWHLITWKTDETTWDIGIGNFTRKIEGKFDPSIL